MCKVQDTCNKCGWVDDEGEDMRHGICDACHQAEEREMDIWCDTLRFLVDPEGYAEKRERNQMKYTLLNLCEWED
tara:strand:+ start:586 stop:810 length:225 start_codon:yes stop_codon:yes gene_type:complete